MRPKRFEFLPAVLAFARESHVSGVLVCRDQFEPLPVWASLVDWPARLQLPPGCCEIRSKKLAGFEPFRKASALVAVRCHFPDLKRTRAPCDV